MPFVCGIAGMGGAARRSTCRCKTSWQRWAWSTLPARRGRPLRPRRRRSGKNTRSSPFLPIHRWEIWNEENIVTFADRPDPADYATLIRISGRILHRADPGAQGDRRRPLRPAAADPAERRLRRLPLAPLPGGQREAATSTGSPCTRTSPSAEAMGAQLDNLRRIMRVHNDDAATPIYVTELGWGSRQRPDPLAARPRTGRPNAALASPSKCSPPTACAGGSAASGGSPGPTKAAPAASAARPAC